MTNCIKKHIHEHIQRRSAVKLYLPNGDHHGLKASNQIERLVFSSVKKEGADKKTLKHLTLVVMTAEPWALVGRITHHQMVHRPHSGEKHPPNGDDVGNHHLLGSLHTPRLN